MANGRNRANKGNSGRDAGGFVALPWSVLDCPAYARLSHPARALLLKPADRERIAYHEGGHAILGFIHETVKGHRPNRASWYAVTWQLLDRLAGYDAGAAESFQRGAYRQNLPLENASLRPSHGVESPPIAPSHGVETAPPTPSHGAIRRVFAALPTPSHGNHLEMPSIAVCWQGMDQGSYKRLTAKPTHLFTGLLESQHVTTH